MTQTEIMRVFSVPRRLSGEYALHAVVDASGSAFEVSAVSALDADFSELLASDGPGKVVGVTVSPGAFVRVICGDDTSASV